MTNLNKSELPTNDAIEALAQCLLPSIHSYFESEEGQREFAEWKSRQGAKAKSAVAEIEKLPLAS